MASKSWKIRSSPHARQADLPARLSRRQSQLSGVFPGILGQTRGLLTDVGSRVCGRKPGGRHLWSSRWPEAGPELLGQAHSRWAWPVDLHHPGFLQECGQPARRAFRTVPPQTVAQALPAVCDRRRTHVEWNFASLIEEQRHTLKPGPLQHSLSALRADQDRDPLRVQTLHRERGSPARGSEDLAWGQMPPESIFNLANRRCSLRKPIHPPPNCPLPVVSRTMQSKPSLQGGQG
jgi:hypothetical protein